MGKQKGKRQSRERTRAREADRSVTRHIPRAAPARDANLRVSCPKFLPIAMPSKVLILVIEPNERGELLHAQDKLVALDTLDETKGVVEFIEVIDDPLEYSRARLLVFGAAKRD